MEIGLRVLALVIDLAVCLGAIPVMLISGTWVTSKLEAVAPELAFILIPVLFVSVFAWPLLYFCIPTAIWGRTLGKLICRLKVTDVYDQGPRFWRKLGREALKCVMIVSGIGFTITFILLVCQGSAWYDNLCGTKVEFSSYIRLTKTQKNYRKYMKDRERGNK